MTQSDPVATTFLLPSFLSGVVEKIGNYLLERTPDREKWLRPLNGKVLALSIKQQEQQPTSLEAKNIEEKTQSPIAYILFSAQRLDLLTAYQGEMDCQVQADFELLRQLCLGKIPQKQQLSQLINQRQIILEGDLQVLQHFTALLEAIEKDPAELLSPYLGDVLAHTTVSFLQQGRTLLEKNVRQAQRHWGERLTEEWQLVAPQLALVDFADQVEELAQQVNQLEQKIARLQQTNN